ncbi:N-alpha-acetyltransferase 35, NatC auxiliary subunit-like isoform X2 [Varroa destructor]|uniref:Protein MAK10 homolog n=1 Tax=Varroa destructor TaxID=109461 RepID=A0A7M7KUW7_VARDE|nr:N-alpha-acetyltransferase 35, NatC auxiliary subunit-like isoform X2 [Varroa destructor]
MADAVVPPSPPVRPPVAFKWRDITENFCSAAKSLALGELFRDNFTLLEAMSAIEMMDPKMDAGMCNAANNNNNNNTKPVQQKNGDLLPTDSQALLSKRSKQGGCGVAEEAVAEGRLKVSDLSALEIRAVLDSSLRLLASWLEGHCLAQTVFTNLYLHLKPLTVIEDRTLRSVALATIKLVVTIRDIVYRIGAFEEEDFHGVMYNFYLALDVPDAKAYSLLKECEDELQKRAKRAARQVDDVKSSGSLPASNGDTAEDHRQPEKTVEERLAKQVSPLEIEDTLESLWALQIRLRFMRLFFQSLCVLEARPGMARGFGVARRILQSAAETLKVIRETNRNNPSKDDDDDSFPTTPGFDATLNQRLLPSTFPRHTKVASCRQAYEYLAGMVDRMLEAMQVVGLSSYNQVLDFFEEFSKKAPCVLSRCIGQLVYIPQPGLVFGVTKGIDVLKDAVRSFCRPPVLLAKTPLSQIAECRDWVDGLLIRCVHPLFGLLQATGHNRARQREKAARLLEDLSLVQEEAELVDSRLVASQRDVDPQAPAFQWFTMWLMAHVLRTQIRYLLAGFELELYAVHEYGYIFWYLYEYLYRFLVTVLSQADHYLADCDRRLKRKLKKDPRSQTKAKKPANKGQGYHHKELVAHQAMQNVCGGLYKTMLGLRMDGKLQQPHQEFDTERTRFEHRFAAFRAVATPPVVSYEQYRDLNDLSRLAGQREGQQNEVELSHESNKKNPHLGVNALTSRDIYSAAARCFTQTKFLLESSGDALSDEQQSLLRLAKHNLVVVNLLASGHLPDAKILFDRGHHLYFPLLRLA